MRRKIVLTYTDLSDQVSEELVWVNQISNLAYRVDNIPFFAPNLALNDIVSIEDDDGVFYFDELLSPSGHSTIQVIFFQNETSMKYLSEIEELGCHWEGLENQPYYAIDVPPDVDYAIVKKILESGLKEKALDYKEACLAQ